MLKSIIKNYPLLFLGSFLLFALFFFFFNKFVLNKEIELRQEELSGDINVLLLGKAGGEHDGPDLTDTIMVASINQKDNTITLVSIPRDLWIPDIDAKINTAYFIGKEAEDNNKLLLKSIVKKVTGKQIDYVAIIDFSGFVKLIDHLNGITINVRNTFDDYRYPITGAENELCGHTESDLLDLTKQIATGSAKEEEIFPCRYEHIHFDSGVQEMNGEDALRFVRSRHGVNGEGSDFARSQRQQDVINAIKEKSLSLGVLLNPIKVLGMFNILRDHIDTNIEVNEIDDFIKLVDKMQNAKITTLVIDEGDEEAERYGLLYNPPISELQGFQWVLIPRVGNGNFSEITEYIECVKNDLDCAIRENGLGGSSDL